MYQKGIKYCIYPNQEQKVFLEKHFGSNRYVYNWGLATKIKYYEKTKKSISCFELIKQLPILKKENEWLKEVNSQTLQMSLRNLDNAFTKFFKIKKGFPKFKNKKHNHKSFQIPQHYELKENKLYIPKFKTGIKIKIHRQHEGELKTLTISKTPTGKYYAVFIQEIDKELPKKKKIKESTTIGIDLGLTHFAIFSNGEKIDNPKYLRQSEKKLEKQQRWLSRKQKGSNNRNKQRHKGALIHEKIINQRKDFQHKLSKRLIENQDTICLEDLNVDGMKRNRRLAKSISDVGWYEFKRQLKYKADWYGKNVIEIGRFQPSSKICSCGLINDNLTLADREWTCDCGITHDRDILAAINIKKFGLIKAIG